MNEILNTKEYNGWLKDLKQRVRQAQLKAAVKVNTALLEFYWELGADIVEKQKNAGWGSDFLKQLSRDLIAEFPDMKGFSEANLSFIRRWFLFYCNNFYKKGSPPAKIPSQAVTKLDKNLSQGNFVTSCAEITKQIVQQLTQIPWGHNRVVISKCSDRKQALYYVQKTIEHGWSRSVLTHQLESRLYEREGKAITNFSQTMPEPQSDLAQQLIKDPYNFDFLTLTDDYNEYALSDIHKPMGVSEYQLTQSLPDNLKSSLPTIEEIEAEFSDGGEK